MGVTKAAMLAMGKMLALELASSRIRVNIICPGHIETEIEDNTDRRHLDRVRPAVEFPHGQIPLADADGTAQEIAELVLFLLSSRARHITGTPVWSDGGQSLLLG